MFGNAIAAPVTVNGSIALAEATAVTVGQKPAPPVAGTRAVAEAGRLELSCDEEMDMPDSVSDHRVQMKDSADPGNGRATLGTGAGRILDP